MGTSVDGKLLNERIERDFTYHAPDEEKAKKHQAVREAGKNFAKLIANTCPAGREQSLALTKIEEVVMWANAALARNE